MSRAKVHYPGGSLSQSLGLCGATWRPRQGFHTGGNLVGITCRECKRVLSKAGVRFLKGGSVRFRQGTKVALYGPMPTKRGVIAEDFGMQRVYGIRVGCNGEWRVLHAGAFDIDVKGPRRRS